MDAVLKTFFSAKHEDVATLTDTFVKQQEQVIRSFGGITNMIEMCLTNPNAQQYIDINSKQFISFEQILESNNHDHSTTPGDTCNNTDNFSDIEICYGNNNDTNVKNPNSNTNDSNNEKMVCQCGPGQHTSTQIRSQSQTVITAKEFSVNKLVISCDSKYTVLFTLIENNNIATFIYNAILSKNLIVFLMFLGGIFTITMVLSLYASSIESTLLFNIAKMVVSIVVTLFCTGLISITNKTIIHLITHTFEFWFQVYNLIALNGSTWIRRFGIANDNDDTLYNNRYEFIFTIFFQIGVALMMICIFLLDAIPLTVKLKRATVITIIVFSIVEIQHIYFYTADYQWNPFNSKYSQISFKSISLSSYINLMIFMSKPIWGDAKQYLQHLRKTLCSKDSIPNTIATDHDKREKYQRCHTVYKRPYLKWGKY